VKKPFTSKELNLLERIRNSNSIGVSIRIGDDYLKSRELNVCNDRYYYKAMNLIREQVAFPEYFIFSDDIKRVKERFIFSKYDKVTYVDGFSDSQSLRLLYNCKYFIIANSSFSWWGAYLSDYPDKIVIAPGRWYNNSKYKPDIYYEGMQIVEV